MADLDKAQQIYDSMSAEQKAQFQKQYGGDQKAQDFLQSQNTNQTQNTVKTQSTPSAQPQKQPQQTPSATTQQGRPELLPESYYKDDTDKRQNEIISNLNQSVYQNPQSLSDYNTFANYYNYEGRTDLQKQTLDNRYLGYQKSQEYSTKSVKELQSLYNANVISQSDLSLLKVYDPNKYNELNSLISKTADLKTYADQLSGTEITTPTNPFQGIIDNFVQGLQSFSQTNFYDEYRDTINSPALKQKNQEIIAEQAEMERLDLLINNKRKDVEKRYAGTGATKSKIAAIIADETYELQLDKANRAISLNAMVNSYNSELGNAREELNLKLQEYNMGLQQRQQQMQELGFAMSLMNFETNAQKDEREWNNFIRQQEYQNGDIFSNDPKVRNKAISNAVDTVLQEFSGIPMLRSREKMIEDITGLVNGGMSLGEAITKNIREPIMNKDEYKQRHSKTFGSGAPQIYDIGGKQMTWDSTTNTYKPVSTSGAGTGVFTAEDLGRPAGSKNVGIDTNNFGNFVNGTGVGNIGTYKSPNGRTYSVFATAEDGYNALIADLKAKQSGGSSKISKNATVAELLGVWVSGDKNQLPGAGYVSAVKGVVGDLNQKFANVSAEKLAEGIMRGEGTWSSYINGGKDLRNLAGGTGATQAVGGGSTSKDSYLDMIKYGSITASDMMKVRDIAEKEGWLDEFSDAQKKGFVVEMTPAQTSQYNKDIQAFRSNPVVKGFEEGLTQFQGLAQSLSHGSGPADMAAVFSFMKTLDPSSVVREKEFESAAKSAGKVEEWSNIYNKLSKGKILTEKQAKDFKEVAEIFIKNKAVSYNRLYGDLAKSLGNFGITQEMLPANASDQMLQFIKTGEISIGGTKQTAPTSGYDFSGLSNGGPIKTGSTVINGVEYNLNAFF